MDTEKKINKLWRKVAILDTYDQAAQLKLALLDAEEHPDLLMVKIKRCGPEGSKFKVKVWHPEFAKTKNNKKRKK